MRFFILFFLFNCFVFKIASADQILQFGNSMELSTVDPKTGNKQILSLDLSELDKKRTFERNDMSGIMCKMMTLLTSDITKAVLAFVLVVMGFGAYLGKIDLGLIVSFVIGVGLIFMIPTILSILAPYSDIEAGCNCKRYVVVAYDVNFGYIYGDLMLNSDCSICPNKDSCQ